ncbi:MAG: pilus assembly protein PilZ [Myxococcales bacterium]|nr:pilus assembly protein PilZ [Myxococcales bacterium]
MSQAAAPLRVVVVGTDADVSASLHLYLERAGCAVHCVPFPNQLEAMVRAVAAQVVVVVLPAVLEEAWLRGVSAASGMAGGAQVTAMAPTPEVAARVGNVPGLRVVGRQELLSRPTLVLDRRGAPVAAPPPAPAASAGMSPVVPPSPPAAASAPPSADLLRLIEEELEEPIVGQPLDSELLEVAVTLVSQHNYYVGPTGRLDSGGVFVASGSPPQVGTAVKVRLVLADGRTVDVNGEVSWVRAKSGVTRSFVPGCGVRLSGVPEWAVQSIERFMKARPPIRMGS